MLAVKAKLEKTFFDLHPQYLPLAPLITETRTPDLAAVLARHENVRIEIYDLLSRLLSDPLDAVNLAIPITEPVTAHSF
jgi:hypothetical protein